VCGKCVHRDKRVAQRLGYGHCMEHIADDILDHHNSVHCIVDIHALEPIL